MKILIYILCYDDSSEKKAIAIFSQFDWARIYRIPEEVQDHTFEGVMYRSELMKMYDEWKDVDFVGTASYKFFDKVKYTDFLALTNRITSMTDVIFFFTGLHPDLSTSSPILTEMLNDICILLFISETGLLSGIKSDRLNTTPRYSFCNFFIKVNVTSKKG
jgi:hypothetical protein